MELLKKYSFAAQAALTHLLLRVLVLLLIEDECARLVQKSSGMPAVAGNYLLIGLFALGFILVAAHLRVGYVVGMFAGTTNVIAKIVILIAGHEFFPQRPYLYILQSIIVLYFCYMAYRQRGIEE
ncbi:MAG: hypothetical protein KKD92_05505 [Proteobacteria bacterium]|nr:hypothetical protein [Pseudomonadota bacterium]